MSRVRGVMHEFMVAGLLATVRFISFLKAGHSLQTAAPHALILILPGAVYS